MAIEETEMRGRRDPFERFGLAQLTWAVRVYLFLLVFFVVLLLLSALPNVPKEVPSVAIEGIQTIVAALLGALSQQRA